MIHKTYKLLFGIILLLVVDIIWVSSSELTKVCIFNEWTMPHFFLLVLPNTRRFCVKFSIDWYGFCVPGLQFLYQNEDFDKPFFCTYFKTSMFTLYLLVLGLIAPWKNSCDPNRNNYTVCLSTRSRSVLNWTYCEWFSIILFNMWLNFAACWSEYRRWKLFLEWKFVEWFNVCAD